ncbi:UrcA family protein [Novosphingobium lubricantis]|jgi:UrcA family protein
MKTVITAISAVSALCLAIPANAAPREPINVTIVSDGMDLTDPGQVSLLSKKVNLAIIEACNPDDRLSNGRQPDLQCRKELRRDAAVKIAALTNEAQRKRMAGL